LACVGYRGFSNYKGLFVLQKTFFFFKKSYFLLCERFLNDDNNKIIKIDVINKAGDYIYDDNLIAVMIVIFMIMILIVLIDNGNGRIMMVVIVITLAKK